MHPRALAALLLLILASATPRAMGLGGDLEHPSLALPQNFGAEKAIIEIINDKQFQFLRGHFVNSTSSLEYGGDAASLKESVLGIGIPFATKPRHDRLAKCQEVKVTIVFREDATATAWTVEHDGHLTPGFFRIIANTAVLDPAKVVAPK